MQGFPEFFVIGAQKSGTTALCSLLARHPGIQFSTPKEPMFFSQGEAWLHPHAFIDGPKGAGGKSWHQDADGLVQGYLARCFPEPANGRLRGEGSTSTMVSWRAPERIARYRPQAKLIALLRHPVDRAYSAYWHYVRHGSAASSFRRHLQYESGLTLQFGYYEDHVRRWLAQFPGTQLFVRSYESFRASPQKVLDEVCAFLGVPLVPLSLEPMDKNRASVPHWPRVQWGVNLLRRRYVRDRLAGEMPQVGRWLERFTERHCSLPHYPPMDAALHDKLTRHYRQQNARLDELLGFNITREWWS